MRQCVAVGVQSSTPLNDRTSFVILSSSNNNNSGKVRLNNNILFAIKSHKTACRRCRGLVLAGLGTHHWLDG